MGARSFAKEFFPAELHATLDGEDDSMGGGQATKRRRVGPKTLGLSSITSYKTAEELFFAGGGTDSATGEHKSKNPLNKALELMTTIEQRHQHGEDAYISGEDDDDDWVKGRNGAGGTGAGGAGNTGNADDGEGGAGGEEGLDEGDSNYEDEYESGDDYNAEAYFDGNQDDEEYDEGGDDGDYL